MEYAGRTIDCRYRIKATTIIERLRIDPSEQRAAGLRVLVSGAASADLLADRLGVNMPHDRDYSTVAGFALSVLKHLPETGELFSYDGWKFEVVDMDGRKIDKLLASRPRRRSHEQEAATAAQK